MSFNLQLVFELVLDRRQRPVFRNVRDPT